MAEDIDYTAVFKIEHGVTGGLGSVDYDDETEEVLQISDADDLQAFLKAATHAYQRARDYVARLDGTKQVSRVSLKKGGKEINQSALIEKLWGQRDQKSSLAETLDDLAPNGNLIIRRTAFQDVLEDM